MENKIEIDELFDEILYIYDDDLVAISLHMSYLIDRKKKNGQSFKKNKISLNFIKQELSEKNNLEKYRIIFLEIMNTLTCDIKKFKNLSKFDLAGVSGLFYILSEITEDDIVFEIIKKRDLTSKKNEIIDIMFYCQKILKKIEENYDKK